MPRVCTVCSHPERAAIDAALVAGEPNRSIARHFNVSRDAIARHKADHLPAAIVKAREASDVLKADSLLERLRDLNRETAGVLSAAKMLQDHDLVLKAIARVEKQIELEGRLIGELSDQQSVHIHVHPEWLGLRTTILNTLAPYPEARLAVAQAIGNGQS